MVEDRSLNTALQSFSVLALEGRIRTDGRTGRGTVRQTDGWRDGGRNGLEGRGDRRTDA